MKKLLCAILSLVILLSLCVPAAAVETEELLEVTLTTYSNKLGKRDLNGLYRDNTLYMHPEVLASLMDCGVTCEEDRVVFTFGGVWTMTIRTGRKEMPSVEYGGAIYLSAPHVLRYAGATVGFGADENAQLHMMVSMPYTVLDLLGQYQNAGGYAFSWKEADGKWVDPQDIMYLAALDTILLCYDSNVMGYAIPGRGENVMEDIYTDILLELLRTDGTDLAGGEDPQVQLFSQSSDVLDFSADWVKEVMDWIEDDSFSDTFHSTMGKMLDGTGMVVSAAGEYMKALEVSRQFANMTDTQKELLDNTLGRVSRQDPARELLPELFSAAEKASDYMDDQYDAQEDAAWKGVSKLMDEALDSWLSVSNPVSFAWDAMTGIAKLDPLVSTLLEAEKNVTFAAETDNIRVIAQQMIDASVSKLNDNSLYIGKRAGEAVYEQLRYEIILSLKASLTSRLLLIESGFLTEESASVMQSKAAATARLLNKAQNAQPICVGMKPTVDEDLTWIAKLAGYGKFGYAVDAGGYSYYWTLPNGGYENTGILGWFTQTANATLIRRDADGKETALFNGTQANEFAVTNTHILTTETGQLYARNIEGKDAVSWGKGSWEAVSSNGRFAVFSNEGTLKVLDLREEKTVTLTTNGSFERLYNDTIYYTENTSYNTASTGEIFLWAANTDGSNKRLMIQTPAGLYDDDIHHGPASIGHMHFGKEGLYFSYGGIAGTGAVYQQGKVVYVSFDGKESRVVAGEGTLVGADFVVHEDGTVTADEDSYYDHFISHRSCFNQEGNLIWVDPVSGKKTVVATPGDYARSDLSYELALMDYVQVTDGAVYFAMNYVKENPEASFGWRTGYDRLATVLYRKDLATGKVEELNFIGQ